MTVHGSGDRTEQGREGGRGGDGRNAWRIDLTHHAADFAQELPGLEVDLVAGLQVDHLVTAALFEVLVLVEALLGLLVEAHLRGWADRQTKWIEKTSHARASTHARTHARHRILSKEKREEETRHTPGDERGEKKRKKKRTRRKTRSVRFGVLSRKSGWQSLR